MANPRRRLSEGADNETVDLANMTLAGTMEDDPVVLDLALEEDIAANLDYYILRSRQGFFEVADSFFEACLEKHLSWFPIVWEYYNCQTIKNHRFDTLTNGFLLRASHINVYTPEETALLDLIVGAGIGTDDLVKRLSNSLRNESLLDIDVSTTVEP